MALSLLLLTGAAAGAPADWPRNDLERLLVAGTKDPAQRPAFYQALLAAELCALTDRKVPDDPAKADPHAAFPILAVKAPDGLPATPVFTAPERATEVFGANTFTICLRGSALLDKVRSDRVVLNPGQPYGITWTAEALDLILGAERMASLADVQLTVPQKPPEKLVARLTERLGAIGDIRAAWLALAYWPKQKEWAWFLELHTSAPHKPIEDLIDLATRDVDLEGKPMDTSFMPPDAPPGKGIQLFSR
ncbi:MAG TPA: enhanced serine sensitivity protein SseB C-terminal domain-containing protein [Rhizomicrobium sp.]|nr:enhanced serine sensitivity protein SseB C-terminal domain-containing protein [Rhizomicrobium sp.]